MPHNVTRVFRPNANIIKVTFFVQSLEHGTEWLEVTHLRSHLFIFFVFNYGGNFISSLA